MRAAGLTDAVAVVAGTDELAHPAIRALLAPEVAQLVARAERTPEEAERFFGGLDAETLWQNPGARHHLVEDGGGALPWTHAEEILRVLLR